MQVGLMSGPKGATGNAPPEGAKLQQVAQQFEAIFVGLMLKEALTNEEGKSLMGSGPGAGVLQDFMEQNLAEQVVRSGGLGIGDQLTRSLSSKLKGG